MRALTSLKVLPPYLEFFRQWKTGERRFYRGGERSARGRIGEGWGGVFPLFPSPIPHCLTDGGRKVVMLTHPNKTPALRARSDNAYKDDEM